MARKRIALFAADAHAGPASTAEDDLPGVEALKKVARTHATVLLLGES